MERSIAYLVIGVLLTYQLKCEVCNLGRSYRKTTTASSRYTYQNSNPLTPDKALDESYYIHSDDCFSSNDEHTNTSAWWEVTFRCISKIFQINLVFREDFVRHAGYYLFITNQTVNASDLIHLDPVYHDEEPSPSQQNTIIFPGGHSGVQVYLYINHSNSNTTDPPIIEPCEVEIYGCVEGDVNESCACANTTIGGQGPDLWQTNVVFPTGSLSLTCDDYYLSIMNMSDFHVDEFLRILEACDGKQHCSFNSSSHIQNKTLMFYCQDKCSNENYTNSHLNRTVVEGLGIEYQPAVSDSFTAFLKSRVYDCKGRHILTSGNLTRQCQEHDQWSGEDPVCNVTCQQPDHDNSTTIHQSRSPIYFEDYSVSYTCREHHRHVHGNLTRVCNGSGDWSGEKPVCRRCKCPCDRVKTQYFITDTEVLRKKINKLNNELKVHRKDLSATVRAKTCAKDERKSSKYLGFITGIGITTAVLVIIVCSDLPLMYRQVRFGPYASRTR
ncbi:uncharacterized protein LOC125683011 [Ostrea edulis]|uniref:uncharacterized protein LOC125683011 n=1 Tax=Ostrea edulis TaxID=37623 RepID=UPI0024AF6769|nr:uncharacterized protein LOC125683011 [Ostrea edulis]